MKPKAPEAGQVNAPWWPPKHPPGHPPRSPDWPTQGGAKGVGKKLGAGENSPALILIKMSISAVNGAILFTIGLANRLRRHLDRQGRDGGPLVSPQVHPPQQAALD
jgi:hypothetical protein